MLDRKFTQRRTSLLAVLAVAASVVAALCVTTGSALGSTRTLSNTSPTSKGLYRCDAASRVITPACLKGALIDFDRARAKEHLRPLVLPSNFRALSTNQQLLVLTNLDRVARRLPAFSGLSTTLNRYAQAGANVSNDPSFPSWAAEGGSNWATTVNPLWSEFLWMYDDGPGSGNMDCTVKHPSGCWGHRRNVLSPYTAARVLGAGENRTNGTGVLYLGADSHDAPNAFRWAREAKYFPGGKLP